MRLFLFGIMMGLIGGILYAPSKGRALRAQLRDKAIALSNDSSGFVGSKSRHIRNVIEGYRAKARKMADDMRSKVSEVRHQVEVKEIPDTTRGVVDSEIARSA